MNGTFPRRGCVYWVQLADEPNDKRRPAVILSDNVRNEYANDYMVVPVSTRVTLAPTHVVLAPGEGGLPARSIAKCEQLTTVAKYRIVGPPLGPPLPEPQIRKLVQGVLRAFGHAV